MKFDRTIAAHFAREGIVLGRYLGTVRIHRLYGKPTRARRPVFYDGAEVSIPYTTDMVLRFASLDAGGWHVHGPYESAFIADVMTLVAKEEKRA